MSVQYTAIFHGCKNYNFQMKIFDIFLIFAQKIDCGCSNEYPQSMFWSKNKKNIYTSKPHFFYIKVGCKEVFITRTCYPDVTCWRTLRKPPTLDGPSLSWLSRWSFRYMSHDGRKTVFGGFRPGQTQTKLYSHRRSLKAWNFGFRK